MINENQKGISVYITVVILAILLAVSLGLSSIIVGGAKIVENLDNSVKAFHAADTGIEKTLYNIRISGDCTTPVTGTLGTDYNYSVTITYSGATCMETGTTLESLGTYKTTNRKIEASY